MQNQRSLPETGYLRISHIIGNNKINPPIPAIIPVGKSTWWQGVNRWSFSKAYKIRRKNYRLEG